MNWTAYLALLFAAAFFVVPWYSLSLAVASSLTALVSAGLRYETTIRQLAESTIAKGVAALIAGSAIAVSPFVSNTAIGNLTLLRPSAFPFGHAAFSLLGVIFLWLVLGWITIAVVAAIEVLGVARTSSPRALKKRRTYLGMIVPLGRVAGLLLLLFYITPAAWRTLNDDSGGLLSRLIVMTDFIENAGQLTSYSSKAPDLPGDCKSMANEKHIDKEKGYTCYVKTRHCANLGLGARISYLSDNEVIVASDVEPSSPLYALYHVRFDVEKCDATQRYDISVE